MKIFIQKNITSGAKARNGKEKIEMGMCWTCPHCGDNLDFGERCSCQDKREEDSKYEGNVVEDPETRKVAGSAA